MKQTIMNEPSMNRRILNPEMRRAAERIFSATRTRSDDGYRHQEKDLIGKALVVTGFELRNVHATTGNELTRPVADVSFRFLWEGPPTPLHRVTLKAQRPIKQLTKWAEASDGRFVPVAVGLYYMPGTEHLSRRPLTLLLVESDRKAK